MDANKILAKMRRLAAEMDAGPSSNYSDVQMWEWWQDHAEDMGAWFVRLDTHLSAGGTPPEEWREGPDAPELDDEALTTCPLGIPHTIQPIEPGVWGTPPTPMAGPDGPLDPLGAPNPADSELPDHDSTAAATVEHGEREV